MEVEIEWSDLAKQDLVVIFDYYAKEANFLVAQKLTSSLVEASLSLKKTPRLGVKEPLFSKRKEEYRYLVEGNYKIIYFIIDNKITISQVFDCRQNPTKMK